MRRIAWLLCAILAGAAQAEPVKFSDRLYAKFHHERCLTCHQFSIAKYPGKSYTTHRNRYLCAHCHKQEVTGIPAGEWLAPSARLDYTGLDARRTCELIKRNMGTDHDGHRMAEHLREDHRLRWALESGRRPDGSIAPIVPGGFEDWRRDVDDWVRDGLLCD
jgi:hypothetical protein